MLKFLIFLSTLLIFPFTLEAQFTESFSDGNFSNSPVWNGNVSHFEVDALNQLHLNATEGGTSFLSTPSEAINNAQWEFYVKMDFNPSGSNFALVYLVSDKEGLAGFLNGYFVKIGGTDDEVSLFRQSGGEVAKIIDGNNGRVNTDPVTFKVKVTRDANGRWELFTQEPENTDYITEGFAMDDHHLQTGFFGVLCKYTSTRSDKFYFDDFIVTGEPFVDDQPPVIEQLSILSSRELQVKFSEVLDKTMAETTSSYQVNNGIGHPNSAILDNDLETLNLKFTSDFINGTDYSIRLTNIKDLNGNFLKDTTIGFLYHVDRPASFMDIVINEIFADPNPQVGLPDVEFIELYNRSEKVFNLSEWIFSDGTNNSQLDKHFLKPGEYLILCPLEDAASFNSIGPVMGLSPWPSLNNDGDVLTIMNSAKTLIDQVNYSSKWYGDEEKAGGGWSLEMIDPDNPCSGEANWSASDDEDGGTPGNQNSIFASKPDLTGPELLNTIAVNPLSIKLTFNEKLDTSSVRSAQYLMDKGINVTAAMATTPDYNLIWITINTPLLEKERYTITINKLKDCNGNLITAENNSMEFALPEKADSMDILISEVLFNPRPLGVDFVEIFNRSDKYINLKGWQLANIDNVIKNGVIEEQVANKKTIIEKDFIIEPGRFLALSKDKETLKFTYPKGKIENFIELNGFPSYPDTEGSVVLVNEKSKIMDRFDYHEDLHFSMLKEVDGVSLERISFTTPGNDPNNWKSAASTAGFATPGDSNSQTRQTGGISGNILIEPKVFTPDNDGNNDFTTIQYSFGNFGNVANIAIYDPSGRKVVSIAENALMAAEGNFTWDGINGDGNLSRTGSYIILLKIFTMSGETKVYKKTVVLANGF